MDEMKLLTDLRDAHVECATLSTRLMVAEKLVEYLNAELRKSWWLRLTDGAKRLMWEHRAKATARKNRDLREKLEASAELHGEAFDALIRAHIHLSDYLWERDNGRLRCTECGVTSARWSATVPEHDMTCQAGRTDRIVRNAIAREHPKT